MRQTILTDVWVVAWVVTMLSMTAHIIGLLAFGWGPYHPTWWIALFGIGVQLVITTTVVYGR